MSDAVLYFWGDNLRPNDISEAVGFPATSSKLKGQETKLANGTTTIAKTGIWCIQTASFELGDNLVDHAAFLAYSICEKARAFFERGVIQQTRILLIISNSSIAQEASKCLELPPQIVSTLSSCNASIAITVLWPNVDGTD